MNTHALRFEQRVTPFIDGRAIDSDGDDWFEVVNPSNGKPLLAIPEGTRVDVDRAVASARRAFEDGRWRDAPPSVRKKILHHWADLIAREAATLDSLDAGEMGKPVSVAAFNAVGASELVRFYAEAIDKVNGDVYLSDKGSYSLQERVPRGVIAAIVPWNFPTFNMVLKAAPALAAGNCVVLKPSELSSRSALHLAHLALQAGLPSGALNIVPGLGGTVGRALGLHMDVDMVAFTGSSAVGKWMLQYAGRSNMKVVQAECGGKSPQIVFDDGVNLDAAAASIASFLLTNQGQICSVGSRLLVQSSIEDALTEKVAKCMKEVVMGDALDPRTTFGPLVSAKQCSRVMEYIEGAPAEQATLVVGGKRALQASGGFFVEPTLFANVAPTARIANEEVFGPVLSVIRFEDEAEALRLANSTAYGLAAYVWTAQLSTGMRMARAIRSTVTVNSAPPRGAGAGHAASFEPIGISGIGVEGGLAGLETYMRRHAICFNHA